MEKLRVYSNYSPAANWFVGDTEPYELFVNLCFFKRANAVRPYRVDDDFCCFPGMPGTAFTTEFCAFEDNIVYPSIHGHTVRSVEKRNAIVPTKKTVFRPSLLLARPKGFDSHACGRLVARGHNAPPERCSVPLVLRIPSHKKTDGSVFD